MSSSASTTSLTHGGSYIDVYVWEVGFGTGEVASMSGQQLSSTDMVSKTPFCAQGGVYTTNCPAGSTYSGYLYEWNVTKYVETYSETNFAAHDSSSNSPYNTVSRQVLIQH